MKMNSILGHSLNGEGAIDTQKVLEINASSWALTQNRLAWTIMINAGFNSK